MKRLFIGKRTNTGVTQAFQTAEYALKFSSILDSGATLYVFHERERFRDFRPAPKDDLLIVGDHTIAIQGYGTVEVVIEGRPGPMRFNLADVAWCPTFSCNLVSFRRLQKQGIIWDTRPAHMCLRRPDSSYLCKVFDLHDQYVLEYNTEPITAIVMKAKRKRYTSWTSRPPQTAEALRWHLRLGHPGPATLENLVRNTTGVKIKGITTVECDACAAGKMKERIRRAERKKADGPGLRIAVDFFAHEVGRGGFKYLVLFSDRWSGYRWDYYLAHGSTDATSIIAVFADFLGTLKRQYGILPLIVESDNEIITTKPAVADWLRGQHIQFEPAAPNTPAQNGGAERAGGVVIAKAASMRTGANLPHELWPEVTWTAIYLLNQTPRRILGWKTPFQQFHEGISSGRTPRIPDQAYLKSYGCKAYVMTTEAKKKQNRLLKLKEKVWIGYLVGYNSSNIFRIWNPFNNQVVCMRDVIFNEGEFFNPNVEAITSALEINLDELSTLLSTIAVPDLPDISVADQPEQEGGQAVRPLEVDDDEPEEADDPTQ